MSEWEDTYGEINPEQSGATGEENYYEAPTDEPAPEPYVEEAAPEPYVEEPAPEPYVEEPVPEPTPAPEPIEETAPTGSPAQSDVPEQAPAAEEPEGIETVDEETDVPPSAQGETFAPGAETAPEPESSIGEAADEPSLDELSTEGATVAESEELPPAAGVYPTQAGFVFGGDMSCWCSEGLPEQWTEWTPPTDPAPESFTERGYSTDWGVVQADGATEGQPLLSETLTEPSSELSSLTEAAEVDVHWDHQGDTDYCGLNSVSSIVCGFHGSEADPAEMVSRAASNGWLVYDEDGAVKGIRPRDIDDMLASYGVGSYRFGGPDGDLPSDEEAWRALNDALTNGPRVVLGINESTGVDPEHFVALTGIDYARGVAILEGSGLEAGVDVPIATFFESWRESGFSMTVTDAVRPGDEQAQPPVGASDLQVEASGFAALGMTLQYTPIEDATVNERWTAGPSEMGTPIQRGEALTVGSELAFDPFGLGPPSGTANEVVTVGSELAFDPFGLGPPSATGSETMTVGSELAFDPFGLGPPSATGSETMTVGSELAFDPFGLGPPSATGNEVVTYVEASANVAPPDRDGTVVITAPIGPNLDIFTNQPPAYDTNLQGLNMAMGSIP